MTVILSTLKKILFWSYERGSWQYDVMCVLILAFILLTPNKFFYQHPSAVLIVRSDEIGPVDRRNLQRAIENQLQKKFGHPVSISRIEEAADGAGGTSYVVYQK